MTFATLSIVFLYAKLSGVGRRVEGRTLIPSDLVSLFPASLPMGFSWSMYFSKTQRFEKLQSQASRVASLFFRIAACLSCCPMNDQARNGAIA